MVIGDLSVPLHIPSVLLANKQRLIVVKASWIEIKMCSVWFGLVLLVLAVIDASGERSAGPNNRPNIVVIVTDDLVRALWWVCDLQGG